jgi:biopolymer transport protein TolR
MGAGVVKSGGGGSHRGRRRGAGRAGVVSEINITPFVDVMLVLLIIFMVAAPLMTVGVPVELPKTAATSLPSEQEEPLSVTLTADGIVMIQMTEVPLNELVTRMQAIASEREGDRIFLRADGSVPYADVVTVMGALNRGGFSNIGLVTDLGGPTLDGTPPAGQGN